MMHKRIMLLLSAHFVALPMATIAAYGKVGLDPAVVLHLSLVFADAGLLGLWSSLAPAKWRLRIPFLVLGVIGLLVFLFAVEKRNIGGGHLRLMQGLVTTLPAVVVFAVLSWLQRSVSGGQVRAALAARLDRWSLFVNGGQRARGEESAGGWD